MKSVAMIAEAGLRSIFLMQNTLNTYKVTRNNIFSFYKKKIIISESHRILTEKKSGEKHIFVQTLCCGMSDEDSADNTGITMQYAL